MGWLGAVAAYLALDVAVMSSEDPATLRAAYVSMGLIVTWVIVPLALAALASGVVMAVGTPWGLLRHYWVLVSLVLTTLGVAVLLAEARTVDALAAVAANPATSTEELHALGGTLPHSVGGLLVLAVILVLNVYKPRGMTRYGWRRQQQSPPSRRRAWRITI